jgi:hypothetical protein
MTTTTTQNTMDYNPYKAQGHANRKAYLQYLSVEYGVPFRDVVMLASLLGAEEDFDGLVVHLEDMSL